MPVVNVCHARPRNWGGRGRLEARVPLSPFVFTNGEKVGVRGGRE